MPHIAKPHLSNKHTLIKKDNLVTVIAISSAVFILIFSLFTIRALLNQSAYQQNVIDEKKDALKIAKQNNEEVKNLEQAYLSFATEPVNIIGGNPEGTGPQDGSNPKLVLDSLPSEYDFPALSSSIEKLLTDNSYQIERIGGSEAVQSEPVEGEVVDINNLEMPYELVVVTTTDGAKNLLNILERSIRPFYVDSMQLEGTDANLQVKLTLKTYYQPAINFRVDTKVVE